MSIDFSNQLVPYLTEQRYSGRLIYSGGDDVFAYTNLWEWDRWLWDVRQCFSGAKDPQHDFDNRGDYWQWQQGDLPDSLNERGAEVPSAYPIELLNSRPLFTMGSRATISFGIVIAHNSVPLAITLESLWLAEAEAKEHFVKSQGKNLKKDAVQARVMFGNGNTLKATSKFAVFDQWRSLIESAEKIAQNDRTTLPAFFEEAALTWSQHPAPPEAIAVWTKAFCSRRDIFQDDLERSPIEEILTSYLSSLVELTTEKDSDAEITNWLKLAAFVLRKRQITIQQPVGSLD